MNTLPTEARETPHLPFGMTAEELLDAVCPAPRRHHLDDQGEPVTRPGLTLRAVRLLRVYPLLLDAFLGESVRLSVDEADALLALVDEELAGDNETAAPTAEAPQTPAVPRKRSELVWGGAR